MHGPSVSLSLRIQTISAWEGSQRCMACPPADLSSLCLRLWHHSASVTPVLTRSLLLHCSTGAGDTYLSPTCAAHLCEHNFINTLTHCYVNTDLIFRKVDNPNLPRYGNFSWNKVIKSTWYNSQNYLKIRKLWLFLVTMRTKCRLLQREASRTKSGFWENSSLKIYCELR